MSSSWLALLLLSLCQPLMRLALTFMFFFLLFFYSFNIFTGRVKCVADIQPFYYTVSFFFLQLVFVKCLSIILCNQHINTYLPSTSTSSYILLLFKPLPPTLFLLHTKHIILNIIHVHFEM